MLYLQFHMDDARYVLPARDVIEVIPLVKLQPLPQVPLHIAGLLCYRGRSVPVIDLCQLMLGRPCNQRLSSRIVVAKARDRTIGLVVEKATEARKFEASEFFASGIDNPATPYQNGVAKDGEGLIQRITTDAILSDPQFDLLFNSQDEARRRSAS
jgi:chemotaxis-related protein WspB